MEVKLIHRPTYESRVNHYVEVVNGTEGKTTCCGKPPPFAEAQTEAPMCHLCEAVKKRREKEAQRRANGTHGKNTSILQSSWFAPQTGPRSR